VDGRRCHTFKCAGKSCKVKIRRYLDTRDSGSTSNMRKHVKSCWGEDALKGADGVKDAKEARELVTKPFLRNGSITAAFERQGKGSVSYSHQQHTKTETRSVILHYKNIALTLA
jgi:hypothetical protein